MGSRVRGPIVFGWSLLQRSDNFHTIIFIRRTYFLTAWFNIVLLSQEQEDCPNFHPPYLFNIFKFWSPTSSPGLIIVSKKQKGSFHRKCSPLFVSEKTVVESSKKQTICRIGKKIRKEYILNTEEFDDCSYYSLQYL